MFVFVFVFASLFLSPSAMAGAPVEQVTFEQALALSQSSPEARAPGFELQARARSDAKVGSSAGPLSVTVMPGMTLGTERAPSFELQAAVTQSWNLAKLGARQRSTTRAERESLSAQARWAALRGRMEAARHWIHLWSQQRILDLTRSQLLKEQAREVYLQRAVDSGAVSVLQLDHQLVILAELEQMVSETEAARFEVSQRLAQAMGCSFGGLLQAAGAVPRPLLPEPARLARLVHQVDRLPQLSVRRLELDALRAQGLETQAQSAAVGQFGAQVERAAPSGWTLFAVLSANIPSRASRARQQALDQAQVARAQGDLAVARRSVELDMTLLLHEFEHLRESAEHLEERLIPRLRRVVERTGSLVDAGEAVEHVRYQAQRELFERRIERQRLMAQRSWVGLRLWLILAELSQQGVR